VQLQGGIHPLLNLKAERAPSRLPVSYRLARLALQYDEDEKIMDSLFTPITVCVLWTIKTIVCEYVKIFPYV